MRKKYGLTEVYFFLYNYIIFKSEVHKYFM